MLMCIQILIKFCLLVLKILSGNEILISIKGLNSVANSRNLTLYNPNLDTINGKDRDSKAPKRGSVFIGLMTPDGAIWSRYQRAVLMR